MPLTKTGSHLCFTGKHTMGRKQRRRHSKSSPRQRTTYRVHFSKNINK